VKKNAPYRLLGVDPGTNILGYAVIEVCDREISVVELGVIHMQHLPTHQEKLSRILERLQEIIRLHQPVEMAIEAPFYGKNVQSMLKLGRAQGVAIAAGMTRGLAVTEYSPKKIKQSVTGNGNAAKEQVAAMLANLLKVDLSEHDLDATDALAAAVCHFFQSQSPLAGKPSQKNWAAFLRDNPDRQL